MEKLGRTLGRAKPGDTVLVVLKPNQNLGGPRLGILAARASESIVIHGSADLCAGSATMIEELAFKNILQWGKYTLQEIPAMPPTLDA